LLGSWLKAGRLAFVGLGLLLWASVRAADGGGAVLTLLEGDATLVVGARAVAAASGLRVAPGTLLETDGKVGFLRLEFADGSLLDLGPGTKALWRQSPRGAQVYVLQGWVKQSQPAAATAQWSPAIELPPFKGVLVTLVETAGTVVFAESGSAQVQPRKGGAQLPLAAGEAAMSAPDGSVQVLKRPPGAWLARIPRQFRDTLPPRAAQLKGPPPQAKAKGPLSYASLQPWLVAEPSVRQEFPGRFAELLADPAFRESVTTHLSQHPEWESALKPNVHQASARK
jgi:hypothetical protein